MESKEIKINIIGAGLSGLLTAYLLEQQGYHPVIWEADDRPGGRMKTDQLDGYQMDRGFQVVLDQYPLINKYFDLEELQLQKLLPGAFIHLNGKHELFGDPSRDFSTFWPSILNSVAEPQDLFKLWRLKNQLLKAELQEHFEGEDQSSLAFLREFGFSSRIIENFFRPFFTGIFLEDELATSAFMLKFVYALFAKGNAVLPRKGIEELPKQLAAKLKNTTFHFNTPIDLIKGKELIIRSVDRITSDHTIIACDPGRLLNQLSDDSIQWNALNTLYFEVDRNPYKKSIIGLMPESKLINHLFFPQSVKTNTKGAKELLSVNLVDQPLRDLDNLLPELEVELRNELNLDHLKLIKHYQIDQALPRFEKMQYSISPEECMLKDGLYLVGDQQLNPSQNSALSSAESAVQLILEKIAGSR